VCLSSSRSAPPVRPDPRLPAGYTRARAAATPPTSSRLAGVRTGVAVMRTACWLCIPVVSTTGCMPSLHRIPANGRRRFYLTNESFQGNQAITACASGYHMASRFEILDVSVLQYDTGKGLTTDDSGAGPPSMAASYESPGP